MRAAVFYGPGDLRLEELGAPVPGPGELLVKVAATGICGTDAAEYANGPHLYAIDGPHPVSGHQGPLVPGHEFVGYVDSLGDGVAGFATGELVACGAGVSCGACRPCREGRTNLCERYWTIGLQGDGGLAELVAAPATTCRSVEPYGLTEDAAALAQPMAIAAHAVQRANLEPGDEVMVVGAGGIGAFITFAAARAGASVTVSEPDATRRAIALDLGAVAAVDPVAIASPDVASSVDRVLEVSGSRSGLELALRAIRPGGRIVAVGLQQPPTDIDLRMLALREVELVGTVAHRVAIDLPAALELLAARPQGWADIAPVAIPLEHLVSDGLIPLADGSSRRVKTLVDPRIVEPRGTVMGPPATVAA